MPKYQTKTPIIKKQIHKTKKDKHLHLNLIKNYAKKV